MDKKYWKNTVENPLWSILKNSLWVGATVCIIYYIQLGFFPKGITIGETITFIIFTFAFSIIYLIYVLILLVCGIFIIRPAAYITYHIFYKKKYPHGELYSDDISMEYRFLIPFISLLFIPALIFLSAKHGYELIICSLFSGVLWYLFQNIKYKNNMRLFPSKEQLFLPNILIFLIILLPLFLALHPSLTILPKSTIRMLNLSFNEITVHIKNPYNNLIASNGMAGHKSQLGNEYLCYEKSDILLDGLFGNTILELYDNDVKLRLSIPNEYILYFQHQTLTAKCLNSSKP